MFDVSPEEITEGKLSRALLVLAAPLVAQQVVVALGAVVDIFWLGRLSEASVAAVGLVAPVYALIALPVGMVYTGTQVLTSQSVGADNHDRASKLPVNGVIVGATVALSLALLTPFVAGDIIALLGAEPAVLTLAVTYLTTYMFAYIPMAVSDGLEAGFIGWGDSRTSLAINVTNILVNAILDPFLIFGWGPFPEWGIFGAAMASIVGVSVSALLAVVIATSGRRNFSVARDALTVETEVVRDILEVGAPIGMQKAGRQAARLGMVAIISIAGSTAALAAYNVGAQLATLAFVPAAGLANASTTVVGQNLGAERPDRARRATWFSVAIAVTFLLVLGAIQWVFPTAIATAFAPTLDGAGLSLTIDYLQILALGYWALGAIYTVESGFNGASKTDVSMYATLIQYWGVRLPIAALGVFALDYGVLAAFWGVTISNIAAALGLAVYFWYSTDDGMLERAADSVSADAAD